MSDQWTDNPDAASDDAPEVLPDTVTEGSREADSVAEGLDAAVGVDSADDPVSQTLALRPDEGVIVALA